MHSAKASTSKSNGVCDGMISHQTSANPSKISELSAQKELRILSSPVQPLLRTVRTISFRQLDYMIEPFASFLRFGF